jgi:predicted dehydrogenase
MIMKNEKKKTGVCLFGAGRAGMIHAQNFRNHVPDAQLVAITDPRRELAENACKELGVERLYTDYKEALDDESIDAAVIATPTVYHKDIAVAAAKAGKHILCEKPMALNEEECDGMIFAAEKNGVILQIAFMRRFDKSFIHAKSVVESGEIGDIVLVKSLTRGPSNPREWMYDIEKSNGPLAEVNSHDIDTLRWFTESEFETVYARGGNYRCRQAKEKFPDFYDNVILAATLRNGMQGFIDGALAVEYGYDARVEILGNRGVIFIGRKQELTVETVTKDRGSSAPFVSSWRNLFKDAYLAEDIHFIESIQNRRTPGVTGFDGKMAVRVAKAGNLSIKEKRVVTLP